MRFRLIIEPKMEEEITARVHKESELTEQLESLVRQSNVTDALYGYSDDDICLVRIKEIEVVFVENNKTFVVTSGGKRYLIRSRLYEVEKKLPPNFIRINKSAVANRRAIVRFQAQISGAVNAIFKSGYVDYVSRRCFSEMKRRYGL